MQIQSENVNFVDSLIIGSGIAGLNLARKLAQAGQKVFVASKEAVTEGSSKYAQGGVAVYTPLNQEDSLESHIEDTIKSGKGLCDESSVKKILEAGWAKVEELAKLGVKFDEGFNIEGSHSYSRVMHVADATGRAIMKPLLDKVSCNHNVMISQGTECLSLIRSGDRVVGASFKTVSGDFLEIYAKNVILATGGLASLFKESTNPEICTGDGFALAHDAGAKIENLEFVQFHPTVFKTKSGKNFLISEAVRGAGAVLRNSKKELFAQKYHKDAELATRDIVSRAIVKEMRDCGSDFVYLDFTEIGADRLAKEFPNITHTCKQNGYDISCDLLPVFPAAHYTIGGIKTDVNGKTTVEGLYAVGECASTGLHGANRLASNSLLECIVISDFAAQEILSKENTDTKSKEVFKELEMYFNGGEQDENAFELEFCSGAETDLNVLHRIKNIISSRLGIERRNSSIQEAIKMLEDLDDCLIKTTALLLAKSTLLRKESRGAHFRVDFHKTQTDFAKPTIVSKRNQKFLNI